MMNSTSRVLGAMILVTAAIAANAVAAADCAVPTPPETASRPVKPAPPARSACVDAKPGTTGCFGWEAYKFNDDVKAYNAALPVWKATADAYVAKLNAYVAASGEYARCEVKALQ